MDCVRAEGPRPAEMCALWEQAAGTDPLEVQWHLNLLRKHIPDSDSPTVWFLVGLGSVQAWAALARAIPWFGRYSLLPGVAYRVMSYFTAQMPITRTTAGRAITFRRTFRTRLHGPRIVVGSVNTQVNIHTVSSILWPWEFVNDFPRAHVAMQLWDRGRRLHHGNRLTAFQYSPSVFGARTVLVMHWNDPARPATYANTIVVHSHTTKRAGFHDLFQSRICPSCMEDVIRVEVKVSAPTLRHKDGSLGFHTIARDTDTELFLCPQCAYICPMLRPGDKQNDVQLCRENWSLESIGLDELPPMTPLEAMQTIERNERYFMDAGVIRTPAPPKRKYRLAHQLQERVDEEPPKTRARLDSS
jgi:hypothetical protein